MLYTHAPLDSDKHKNVTLTLSAWGLSNAEFLEVTTDWFGWWQGLVDGAEVIVNQG